MKTVEKRKYDTFHKTRLALFVKSYSGYLIANYIKNSETSKQLIERLAKVLLFDQKLLQCLIMHKTCIKKISRMTIHETETREKISVYLKIEKELMLLAQEKSDKNCLAFQDYEYALLAPSIERVAGNSLASVEDDHEFGKQLIERKNLYNKQYYEIAYKYKIPTLRIVPFILRLISSPGN